MAKDYGAWSLAELKSELKARNAKLTGKKAVLVQRLEDYDQLFGPLVNDSESVYKITVPSPNLFRDITSSTTLPRLTEEDQRAFCELIGSEDVECSTNMYEEYFLIACRSALQDGDYYVTGVCASEMRKKVNYNVTIKTKDHMFIEAQCECAAGSGPYGQCKHIVVLICAIIDFNKNKTIKLKTSCTSSLQTFHHPSTSYTGNPIQAEHLTLKFKDATMKSMTQFDPRLITESPNKYQEDLKP